MGAGSMPPGEKRPGREVDQLSLSRAEFENTWNHTATHPHAFYIHGSVHRESNLTFVQQDVTYTVYLSYDTHESVPTQQRERVVVDPVNQYQKL